MKIFILKVLGVVGTDQQGFSEKLDELCDYHEHKLWYGGREVPRLGAGWD